MMRSLYLILLSSLICVVSASSILSQDAACSSAIALALPRAHAACAGIERNQVCYGNGNIETNFQTGTVETAFDTPGHKADIASLVNLHLHSTDETLSMAQLDIQANLTQTDAGRNVTLLLFGDVEIRNNVPPLPEIPVTTTGNLNIRALPNLDADIIQQLTLRETIIANGRTEDNNWLRVTITETGQLGWIAGEGITANETIDILDIATTDTPLYQPFQIFTLHTGSNDAPCSTMPESGLVIQTPNDFSEVELTINGVKVQMTATTFVQAESDDLMEISVLDGWAEATAFDTTQRIPAGTYTQIALDSHQGATTPPEEAQPYDFESLAVLPTNNLPNRIVIAAPLAQEEIAAILAEAAAPIVTAMPDSTMGTSTVCRRAASQDIALTAGPGTFYETIGQLSRGGLVVPIYQIEDADGNIWWQLRNSQWLPANLIVSSGECDEVPIITSFDPPANNTLSIEDCVTSNGPLRQGQRVTITFIDGKWETYEDAVLAPRIDLALLPSMVLPYPM